jgi:hypothetical protein
MISLIRIGLWRSDTAPDLPDPHAWIDEGWDEGERAALETYLSCGTVARAFVGFSPCRICGERNGNLEYSDGRYLWPEGLSHYVEKHSVRLPAEFVAYAVGRLEQMESAQTDESWWRSLTGSPTN